MEAVSADCDCLFELRGKIRTIYEVCTNISLNDECSCFTYMFYSINTNILTNKLLYMAYLENLFQLTKKRKIKVRKVQYKVVDSGYHHREKPIRVYPKVSTGL